MELEEDLDSNDIIEIIEREDVSSDEIDELDPYCNAKDKGEAIYNAAVTMVEEFLGSLYNSDLDLAVEQWFKMKLVINESRQQRIKTVVTNALRSNMVLNIEGQDIVFFSDSIDCMKIPISRLSIDTTKYLSVMLDQPKFFFEKISIKGSENIHYSDFTMLHVLKRFGLRNKILMSGFRIVLSEDFAFSYLDGESLGLVYACLSSEIARNYVQNVKYPQALEKQSVEGNRDTVWNLKYMLTTIRSLIFEKNYYSTMKVF